MDPPNNYEKSEIIVASKRPESLNIRYDYIVSSQEPIKIILPSDLITPLIKTSENISANKHLQTVIKEQVLDELPPLEVNLSESSSINTNKETPSIISQIMSPGAIKPPVIQNKLPADFVFPEIKSQPERETSFDKWTHRIYCISLKTSIDRRERIKKRFAYHGLLPWLTFVDAIPIDSPLMQRYVEGTGPGKSSDRKSLAIASCFASHLKALRLYLEDPNAFYSRGAIICEDDILLRNNWRELYKSIMGNMPIETNMIQFSYMLDTWGNTIWIGNDPRKENIFRLRVPRDYKTNPNISSTAAWGTQMYWISASQAVESLNRFDRPFIHQSQFSLVTAELITVLPRGCFVYPAMVIEDCIGSLIQDNKNSDLNYHIKIFSPWGYSNYSGGDDDGTKIPLSPLFLVEIQNTGRRPQVPPKSKYLTLIKNPVA
uniref:Glycosyltransferase family 25 n=1 Tax=Pithovirus LCPAC202 TaxID=2506592 RepID=A0A481Z5Y0_9VIRU|nr:MAG: glycosyltransferase family 25 [Pithovirus LCPAC202]